MNSPHDPSSVARRAQESHHSTNPVPGNTSPPGHPVVATAIDPIASLLNRQLLVIACLCFMLSGGLLALAVVILYCPPPPSLYYYPFMGALITVLTLLARAAVRFLTAAAKVLDDQRDYQAFGELPVAERAPSLPWLLLMKHPDARRAWFSPRNKTKQASPAPPPLPPASPRENGPHSAPPSDSTPGEPA